jgi:excisionase family DNA binding protein
VSEDGDYRPNSWVICPECGCNVLAGDLPGHEARHISRPSKDALTTSEAAKVLGVKLRSVRSWIEKGQLPATAPGKGQRRFVKLSDLKAFVKVRQRRNPSFLVKFHEAGLGRALLGG